jgi:hypothetical protein
VSRNLRPLIVSAFNDFTAQQSNIHFSNSDPSCLSHQNELTSPSLISSPLRNLTITAYTHKHRDISASNYIDACGHVDIWKDKDAVEKGARRGVGWGVCRVYRVDVGVHVEKR